MRRRSGSTYMTSASPMSDNGRRVSHDHLNADKLEDWRNTQCTHLQVRSFGAEFRRDKDLTWARTLRSWGIGGNKALLAAEIQAGNLGRYLERGPVQGSGGSMLVDDHVPDQTACGR